MLFILHSAITIVLFIAISIVLRLQTFHNTSTSDYLLIATNELGEMGVFALVKLT